MDLMQDPGSMGLVEDQVPGALWSIRFHGPYGASGSMGLMEHQFP